MVVPTRPPLLPHQRLLVPAYFYPSGTIWQDTCDAIIQSRAEAIMVMNPASGPGTQVDPAYQAALTSVRKTITAIGYVNTDHGARAPAEVTAEIDLYRQLYPRLRGIFFDNLSNDVSWRSRYQGYYTHVKNSWSPAAVVVGNAGIPASSPWQVTDPVVADIVIVFEGPAVKAKVNDVATSYDSWAPRAWVKTQSSDRIANLVYESADDAMTLGICRASQRRNAGWIYVTRDRRPNPWDTRPSTALLGSPTLFRRS